MTNLKPLIDQAAQAASDQLVVADEYAHIVHDLLESTDIVVAPYWHRVHDATVDALMHRH